MDLIKVFVSYSRMDMAFAQRLDDALSAAGMNCFIDSRIEFGNRFVEKIDRAVAEATHFICLISKASLASPWLHHEIGLAKTYGVKLIPILLEPNLQLAPTLDMNIQYIEIFDHDLSDDDLYEHLIQARMFEDGIVPIGLFKKYKWRFANEFFASELLTQPVFFKRKGQRTEIRINRSKIKYVVISNRGKDWLCERFVKPKRSDLIKLDRRILSYMRSPGDEEPPPISTTHLPLRWASGGVLSIVNHDDKAWVPLFFRDVPPYGWNVSLGATERYFNDQRREIDDRIYSWAYELSYPWKFIVREFLEETLVLDRPPCHGDGCEWRRFDFPNNVQIRIGRDQAERFAAAHLELRQNQDGLDIPLASQGMRLTIRDQTAFDLKIVGGKAEVESPGAWDVLVAINPVELGIEVIKVFEYDLPPKHCILDGEMNQIGKNRQMVRMPIGLLSLEYLYKNFGAPDYQLQFTDEKVHPSVQAAPFNGDDIEVFKWDFDQRRKVWGGSEANAWEKRQYAEWRNRFERAFAEGFGGNRSAFPHLFTPATVKALNLFFNCCQRGQNLASEYKQCQ